MLNRSNDDLPVFYTRHNDMIMGSGKPIIDSLEINDFSCYIICGKICFLEEI